MPRRPGRGLVDSGFGTGNVSMGANNYHQIGKVSVSSSSGLARIGRTFKWRSQRRFFSKIHVNSIRYIASSRHWRFWECNSSTICKIQVPPRRPRWRQTNTNCNYNLDKNPAYKALKIQQKVFEESHWIRSHRIWIRYRPWPCGCWSNAWSD